MVYICENSDSCDVRTSFGDKVLGNFRELSLFGTRMSMEFPCILYSIVALTSLLLGPALPWPLLSLHALRVGLISLTKDGNPLGVLTWIENLTRFYMQHHAGNFLEVQVRAEYQTETLDVRAALVWIHGHSTPNQPEELIPSGSLYTTLLISLQQIRLTVFVC